MTNKRYYHPDDKLEPEDERALVSLFALVMLIGGFMIVLYVKWTYGY